MDTVTRRSLFGLDPEYRKYVRGLLRSGRWTLHTGGRTGHLKLVHVESNRRLAIGGTPGDWRALRNFQRQVAHIERGWHELD